MVHLDDVKVEHCMVNEEGQQKGCRTILQERGLWPSRYLRQYCNYSYNGLVAMLPEALASVSKATIRRHARKCFRYMDAYSMKNGQYLSMKQVEFAVRKYRRHRSVPNSILSEL
uniref:Uncharacterized protein n=1 Tax=Spongospora subterranea TaxID=70186 RepID=A0A0H5QXQ0_9EUKA|eukprot:CRZ06517.1 hypothetical protein [Spongospora subterranea]